MSVANTVTKINDTLYIIGEINSLHRYVIIGDEKALLLDTGYGYVDFRHLIKEITDLPLIVVNTHGHPDHGLGNYLFDKVYIHQADMIELEASDDKKIKADALAYRFNKLPGLEKEMDVEAYMNTSCMDTEYVFIDETTVFDLGNRKLEVIETPGHSAGSICLFEPATGYLFSGDTLCHHNIWYFFDMERCLPFRYFLYGLNKLKDLQPKITKIFPAHDETPISTKIIDETIACVYDIVENHENDQLFESFAGNGYEHHYGNAFIIYSKEHLDDALTHGLSLSIDEFEKINKRMV